MKKNTNLTQFERLCTGEKLRDSSKVERWKKIQLSENSYPIKSPVSKINEFQLN